MSNFTITRSDGTQLKAAGYKFAAPKLGTKKYAASKYQDSELPAKVDLRPYMTTVENQGETSSCVANAVAGAYEYLVKRYKGHDSYDVSRLFIYYNARKLQDWENLDEGSVIADAIEGLKKWGACSEETWPFDENIVLEKPAKSAYEEAKSFLVEDVKLVPMELYAWKQALAEGNPIIFGISLYESFDSHRKKGLVPVPSKKEVSREEHGGHAMLCVGYSDADNTFIVRNSWGDEWGDRGYCYIPYDYLINEKFNDADSWIIKQLDNFPSGENSDTWGEEESVIEESESEISKMTNQEYTDMLDAMGKYAIEYRVALVLMRAFGINKSVSQEKLQELTSSVDKLLTQLNVAVNAEKLVMNCLNNVENDELIRESVGLLAKYLSQTILTQLSAGTLISQLGLSQSTQDMIKYGLTELGGNSLISQTVGWLGEMFSSSVVSQTPQVTSENEIPDQEASSESASEKMSGSQSSEEDDDYEDEDYEEDEEDEDDDDGDDDGDDENDSEDDDDDDEDDEEDDDDDDDDDDDEEDDDGEDDDDDDGDDDGDDDDDDDGDDDDDDDDDDSEDDDKNIKKKKK